MATLRITNLTATDYWLNDIYATVPASSYVDVVRSPSEISAMDGLQNAVAAGTLSADTTYSAAELAAISADNQPLASPLVPGSLTAEAVAPVAAAAVAAAPIIFFKALASGGASGTPDDVTIYAVNTLPYKIRILDAVANISTAVGASTLQVRSAAGGVGTLAATLSSAATGTAQTTSLGAGNVSVVLTPGASVGLFVRRSDRSVVGEILITARRES